MKKIIYIFLFFFLSQCGYSPLYNNIDSEEISIVLKDIKGDNKINNVIKSQLRNYLNDEKDKLFKISLSTSYKKIIISKDNKGVAVEYKLEANTKFNILYDGKNYEFSVNEKLNTKNSSNSFELKRYENIVKNNFAESITKKLILKLISIK